MNDSEPALTPPPAAHTEVAARLYQAVRQAGGNKAVAERAGVPLGTLNNYMRGRNGMKAETLRLLADACGISLEWLLTGTQPEPAVAPALSPAAPSILSEAQAPAPLPDAPLDRANLAKAIEIVRATTGRKALVQEAAELARQLATVYAVLTRPPPDTD